MIRTPPFDWLTIHWPGVAPENAANWIAVLPLAATEQHGPHLPLTTDVLIADAYIAKVRELLPQDTPATFMPVESVGISTEHMDFPGTQTLTGEAALRAWTTLGEEVARRGIRKIVMVSSHGGNSAAMTMVAQDLRARHRMLAVTTAWSRFGVPDGLFDAEELRHGIHGAIENTYRWLGTQRPAPFAWQTQDLHPSGAVGDATQASAKKGERLLEHGARAFCELLADMARFDPAQLKAGPRDPT
ncbi:MAG: Creatininase [Nitrobacter vulgaris]|nr:Creatininase [Nitrobacter vulgaris]